MKIRTDFVTNSSSSSFLTIKVKSDHLQKHLEVDTEEELNEYIEDAVFQLASDNEESSLPCKVWKYKNLCMVLLQCKNQNNGNGL